MAHFNPPARIDDFSRSSKAAELAAGWDAIVDEWLTSAAAAADGLFFNPRAPGAPTGGDPAPIAWDAFPLVIRNWFRGQPDGEQLQYAAAETLRPILFGGRKLRAVRNGALAEELDVGHRQQDEYCEWFATRDGDDIVRIDFTSEGPEYWEYLCSGTRPFFPDDDERRDITSGDPELVLELYRQYVSPDVQPEDLLWQHDVAAWTGRGWGYYARAGEYNRHNRWNTTHGAMHLTHPSNTLGAEVRLASDGTVLRQVADDAEALICCAGYGNVNRSSDPLIGFAVNQAAAAGNAVTLADPVGLYIADMNTGALSVPEAWKVVRGSAQDQQVLRACLQVPPAGLEIAGVPLRYGGQVADHIQMILTGTVVPREGQLPSARQCEFRCCAHPERPSFHELVEQGGDCEQVPWDTLGPFVGDEEPVPAFAGRGLRATGRLIDERVPAPTHR